MHGIAVRQAALALIAAGINDCEVAPRLGVPRTTVRDWRARRAREICWRCCDRSCWSHGSRELFLSTCAGAGVKCSVGGNRIAVYRRPSVALPWEHVGTKS